MKSFNRVDLPIKHDNFTELDDETVRQLGLHDQSRRADHFWKIAKLKLIERSHLLVLSAGMIVIDQHQSIQIYMSDKCSISPGNILDLYQHVEAAIRNNRACKIFFRKGRVEKIETQPNWYELLSKMSIQDIRILESVTKERRPINVKRLRRILLPDRSLDYFGICNSDADTYFAQFFIACPALEISGHTFRFRYPKKKKDRLADGLVVVRNAIIKPRKSSTASNCLSLIQDGGVSTTSQAHSEP
ncbi:MAG: hypothetical protein WCT04_14190 [Planctomycetota bacterium]